MAKEPTDRQLKLVARHGSGPVERALAIVQLAKRRGREDDLHQLVGRVCCGENGSDSGDLYSGKRADTAGGSSHVDGWAR